MPWGLTSSARCGPKEAAPKLQLLVKLQPQETHGKLTTWMGSLGIYVALQPLGSKWTSSTSVARRPLATNGTFDQAQADHILGMLRLEHAVKSAYQSPLTDQPAVKAAYCLCA